jgi:hypothetical protein
LKSSFEIFSYMTKFIYLSVIFCFLLSGCKRSKETLETDVLVLGAGTGGTSAAIQSSRMGVSTILVDPVLWPGGMLTSAGVSAIDGNHNMPAGIWGEFREKIRNHYGGPKAVETGWVSNTLFEPSVGAKILNEMIDTENLLTYFPGSSWSNIKREGNFWIVRIASSTGSKYIKARVLIDGTDLGDVAAESGAQFDIGMESSQYSGESIGPERGNDIIQDLTYVAILKDYGENNPQLLAQSSTYDPYVFDCACLDFCNQEETKKVHPCSTMMTYAKLPNQKYLINWPINGNDVYLDIISLDQNQREEALKIAKQKTMDFIYFIQHQLGYKHLGLADDEFPTEDLLPLIPYHREGRRIHGLVRFNLSHLATPFDTELPLYRTGVAVGDYPIDHHHYERPDAPEIDFPSVPSFSIPMGALIPKGVDYLLVADKAISVSNIVNGSTRLQPVILQVGQAAGALAALSIQHDKSPSEIPVRLLQSEILKYKGYLMPYFDVKPDHPFFEEIQKTGATGILRGIGEPYLWANRTWFYPDSMMYSADLYSYTGAKNTNTNEMMDVEKAIQFSFDLATSLGLLLTEDERALILEKVFQKLNLPQADIGAKITRGQMAVILQLIANPFESNQIDYFGNFID